MNIFINHPSPYLTDCEPHGDGLIAFHYIAGLAERGHQVYVASPFAKLARPLPPNVHLTMIPTAAPASPVDLSRRHRLQYAWRVRTLLRQLRREVHFDVIHQLNPATSWVHLFLPTDASPFIVGPVVAPWPDSQTSAGGWKDLLRVWLRESVRRDLFGKAHRVLIPVPSARAYLPSTHGLDAKIRLLPYGVDTEVFAPLPATAGHTGESGLHSLSSLKQDPHVLFLANLEKRKGIYDLLQAFQIASEAVPSLRLTIAGDGSERQNVEHQVRKIPAADRITLLGRVSRGHVAAVMNACTVYCLPSHGEPFGMSALEAMACGKPLIATAAGGLDDLVQPDGGIKVPVNNPQKLADAILHLATRPDLCKQMGEQNRARVMSRYSWDSVLDRLEQIYRGAIRACEVSPEGEVCES